MSTIFTPINNLTPEELEKYWTALKDDKSSSYITLLPTPSSSVPTYIDGEIVSAIRKRIAELFGVDIIEEEEYTSKW